VTATANGQYQFSLAGITHLKFVTSGTFTATNVSMVLTTSPNASLTKSTSSTSGAPLNASAAAGGDIGAKVNTLFTRLSAAGQNGTVTIDPTATNGNQVTAITVPLGDTLNCQGATLNWPSTGNQIIYSSAFTGGTQSTQGAIRNCTLLGAGRADLGSRSRLRR
jgi:hypothetical protein